MGINISTTTTTATRRRRQDGGPAAVASTNTKSSKREAIIRTFRIFDDGLRVGYEQNPLIHIKDTVSFDLNEATEIYS
jgi:hypothetical protein